MNQMERRWMEAAEERNNKAPALCGMAVSITSRLAFKGDRYEWRFLKVNERKGLRWPNGLLRRQP